MKDNFAGFPPCPCLSCERRNTFHLRCRTYNRWFAQIHLAKLEISNGKDVVFITPKGNYYP